MWVAFITTSVSNSPVVNHVPVKLRGRLQPGSTSWLPYRTEKKRHIICITGFYALKLLYLIGNVKESSPGRKRHTKKNLHGYNIKGFVKRSFSVLQNAQTTRNSKQSTEKKLTCSCTKFEPCPSRESYGGRKQFIKL